jgi:tape measure domain-containing protein
MGLGLELAKAYVSVRADASKLGGDLGMIQSMLQEGLALEAGVSFVMFHKMTDAISDFMHKGSEFQDVMEGMEIELGHFARNGTEELVKGLTKFSDRANIGIRDVMEMGRGFLQLGYSTADTVATLEMLGNASGGTLERFKKLTMVYRMLASGSIDARRAFFMLKRDGTVTMQDLAKHFKVTEAEAKKMLKSGKVHFSDFQNILKGLSAEGGRFEGALTNQAETSKRVGAQMQEVWTRVARAVYDPLDKYATKINNELKDTGILLERIARAGGQDLSFAIKGVETFGTIGTVVAGAMTLFESLYAILPKMGFMITSKMQLFKLLFGVVAMATVVTAVITAIGAALGYLVSKFKVLDGLSAAWDGLKKSLTSGWLAHFLAGIGTIFDRFSDMLGIVMDAVGETIQGTFALIKETIGEDMWDAIGKDAMLFAQRAAASLSELGEAILDLVEWTQVFVTFFPEIFQSIGQRITLLFLSVKDTLINTFIDAAAGMQKAFKPFFDWIVLQIASLTLHIEGLKSWATKFRALNAEEIANIGKKIKGGTDFSSMLHSNSAMEFLKENPQLDDMWDRAQAEKDRIAGLRRKPGAGADVLGNVPPGEPEGPKGKGGIFDISGFGKKIQQMMLDDQDDRMVEAIEEGNAIQEGILLDGQASTLLLRQLVEVQGLV